MAGDYTFTSPLTITFTTDASEAAVTLEILDLDTAYTGNRTFELQLGYAVGGSITSGKDVLEVTIIDNGMTCSR